MLSSNSLFFRSRLSLRFLSFFVVTYTFTTGILAVIYTQLEHQRQSSHFKQNLGIIESVFRESLTQSLIQRRTQDLNRPLASIILLTNINRVELIKERPEILSFGDPKTENHWAGHIGMVSKHPYYQEISRENLSIGLLSLQIYRTPQISARFISMLDLLSKAILQALFPVPAILLTFCLLVSRYLNQIANWNKRVTTNSPYRKQY